MKRILQYDLVRSLKLNEFKMNFNEKLGLIWSSNQETPKHSTMVTSEQLTRKNGYQIKFTLLQEEEHSYLGIK
jgi:hypothetical protein